MTGNTRNTKDTIDERGSTQVARFHRFGRVTSNKYSTYHLDTVVVESGNYSCNALAQLDRLTNWFSHFLWTPLWFNRIIAVWLSDTLGPINPHASCCNRNVTVSCGDRIQYWCRLLYTVKRNGFLYGLQKVLHTVPRLLLHHVKVMCNTLTNVLYKTALKEFINDCKQVLHLTI